MLAENNKKYYRELEYHRQQAYRQQKQQLEGARVRDDYLNVQLFEFEDFFLETVSLE